MKAFCIFWRCLVFVAFFLSGKEIFCQTQTYLTTTPYGAGGMENSAIDTINSSTTANTRWHRNNASLFLFYTATAPDTVRSGDKALRVNFTSSAPRIIFSPTFKYKPTASQPVTIQYFERSPSTTNTANVQPFVRLNSTTSTGSYGTISVANTWEKKYFTTTANAPGSGSGSNYYGAFNIKRVNSGGNYYLDDVCIYSGPYDQTPPNPVTNVIPSAGPSIDETTNSTNTVTLNWTAPVDIDGGGYMVVVYDSAPYADNDPNQNGVYSLYNVIKNGTVNLPGIVGGLVFGTNTANAKLTVNISNLTASGQKLKPGTQYWFKVYAFDKAFNYSPGITATFTTTDIQNYYNKLNQPLNSLSSWGTNMNGSGTQPASFQGDFQIFNVLQNAGLSADWKFGGVMSKIIVGDGNTPVKFTIPDGTKLLPYDEFASYWNTIDVLKNATLTLEDSAASEILSTSNIIYLGEIKNGTLEYSSMKGQKLAPLEYGNLVLNGGYKEPSSDLVIAGDILIKNNIEITPGFQFYVGANCHVDAFAPSPDPDDPTYNLAGTTINYTGNGTHIVADNGWGPAIFKNVNIYDGSKVELNSNVYIHGDLYIDKGTLSIGSNELALNGNFYGNPMGTLTGSKDANLLLRNNFSGKLFFNQGAPDGNYLNSFTINSDVELGNKLQIAPSVFNYGATTGFIRVAGGTLNTGSDKTGELVLTSDATGTARIAEGDPDGGYIKGKVTMQQYFPARRAWRLITAPVDKALSDLTINKAWQNGQVYNSQAVGGPFNYNIDDYFANSSAATPVNTPGIGTHITRGTTTVSDRVPENVLNQGFDFGVTAAGASSSLRIFNGSNFESTIPDGTHETGLADYPAYMLFIRGDRTVTLANNNAVNPTTLQYSSEIGKGHQTVTNPVNGPTLIGNPYPSPIDFDLLHNLNPNLQEKFYVWDARLGSFGGYRVVQNIYGYESNPVDVTLTNDEDARHIQTGQGFFVLPEVNGSGVQFEESFKSDFSRPQLSGRKVSKMYISMYQRSAGDSVNLADGVTACFDESFKSAIDNQDALKFSNFNENFYLRRNGKRLSIETRSDIKLSDTLFFGFTNMVVRDYQFKLKADNFGNTALSAYLIDKFQNKIIAVALDGSVTSINFSVTSNAASKSDDRFLVVFRPTIILPVTLTSVKAYKKNNDIEVEWVVNNEIAQDYYEVEKSLDGVAFETIAKIKARNGNSISEVYTTLDAKPVNGINFYRIKIVAKSGDVRYSAVVRVLISNSQQTDISFFPNPATGRQMSLQFANVPPGNYSIELFNQMGQKVYSRVIVHSGGISSQTLMLDNNFSKGVYQAKVYGPVSKHLTLVIQ